MDAPGLGFIVIAAAVVWIVPRVLLQSVGRASDGIAQLFVPPDRGLGWPHGVQESDDPWGWRVAGPGTTGEAADPSLVTPQILDVAPPEILESDHEIVDLPGPSGGLVVALRPVRPH